MKRPWKMKAAHTIDLGHEQLLLLEGERGARPKVLFRGAWLSEGVDLEHRVPSRDEHAAPVAAFRFGFDWIVGRGVAFENR